MSGPAGVGVYQRMFPLWDGYFAVVVLAVGFAVLIADDVPVPRRLGAVLAIAGIGLVYGVFGRRVVQQRTGTRRAVVLITVQSVLFGVAIACSSVSTFLLFAVLPMIFLAVPMSVAFWFVIGVNLLPVIFGLIIDGFTRNVLTRVAPIALISMAFALWQGYWVSRVVEQSVERGSLIDELERSRAKVARLSHEAGAASERARLAGEIHDTVAQGFTSIIALLQAADPELKDERLALAVRTARENLAESRALVAALAPAALASASLPEAVRRQTSRFTEESGIPAALRLTGEVRELPTATEVVLLRSAQEALANVRRHAAAHEVTVLLAYTATSVRLVVRDDGRGFPPADPGDGQTNERATDEAVGVSPPVDGGLTSERRSGGEVGVRLPVGAGVSPRGAGPVAVDRAGFGLRGMRARAEQVAGVLRITSSPAAGTTIELEVPA